MCRKWDKAPADETKRKQFAIEKVVVKKKKGRGGREEKEDDDRKKWVGLLRSDSHTGTIITIYQDNEWGFQRAVIRIW